MNIPVVLHNRKDGTKKCFQLDISPDETVRTVESRLCSATGASIGELKLLLCGKILESHTAIKDLLLGPSTSLIALVVEHSYVSSNVSTESSLGRETPQIGSFHLWCKACNELTRGKLRVHCSTCKSQAVVVQNDPQGWLDVLKSKRIKISCEDCKSQDGFATFNFKCTTCSEVGAPLMHVRGNWEDSPCCVCLDESQSYMFDLGCNHPTCRTCFASYVQISLNNARFQFKVPYGFTITCPFTNCEQCVRDVHHFYILGTEAYRRYQKMATEKLIDLDDQGVFCPFPDCNSSFFWESYQDDQEISCPDCMRSFCRLCKSSDCVCNADEESKTTIEETTRKCPGCSAATEKNGGCSHMTCSHCGLDWCFRCQKSWSEECQWNHCDCVCNAGEESKTTIEETTQKCPGCSAVTEKNGGCSHMTCSHCGLDWCFRCQKSWSEECQWNHWFD